MPATLTALEGKYDGFYAPTFEIDIRDGATFSTAEGQASSVTISTGIEGVNRVSFSVAGVYDQQRSNFTGLARQGLVEGRHLSVEVGYGDTTEPIMTGQITGLKPSFPESDQPTVDVVGHDYRDAMKRSSTDDSWSGSTVEDVARSVAQRYGFSAVKVGGDGPSSAAGSKLEFKRLMKDAKSDHKFLQNLAQAFDYEQFSRAGEFTFRRPNKDAAPTVSLTYGTGLRSFTAAERSAETSVGTVTYKGTNHYTGERLEGSSERAAGGDAKIVRKAAMESNEEAQRRSMARATEIDRRDRHTATTVGLPDLRIGDWIELTGLGSIGDRSFGGRYYVMEATHNLGGSGYTSRVSLSESTGGGRR